VRLYLITAGIAWLQRRRLPREERYFSGVNLHFTSYWQSFQRQKAKDKILNILLVVAVIGVIGRWSLSLSAIKTGKNSPSSMSQPPWQG